MADFRLAKVSASRGLSNQMVCSRSVSRNAFSRDSTVDSTEAMACSEVFSAAPASHRALSLRTGGPSAPGSSFSPWCQMVPADPVPALASEGRSRYNVTVN